VEEPEPEHCCFDDWVDHWTSQATTRPTAAKVTASLLDAITEAGVADRTVFDVGCGIGDLAIEVVARGGASGTGCDLSPKAIEEARSHGDLSENAEYHAAKEQQGWIEARVAELEDKISRADVIDISKLSGKTVMFGARVTLVDEESDEESTYQIVGEFEADVKKGKISVTSPIARAIIGKSVGDSVEVATPGGGKSYEILKVNDEVRQLVVDRASASIIKQAALRQGLITLRGHTTQSGKSRVVPISTDRLRDVLAWLRVDAEGQAEAITDQGAVVAAGLDLQLGLQGAGHQVGVATWREGDEELDGAAGRVQRRGRRRCRTGRPRQRAGRR